MWCTTSGNVVIVVIVVGVVVNIFITSIVCINIHFELKLSRTLNFRMVSEGGFTTHRVLEK
jgi:hypothetical protein